VVSAVMHDGLPIRAAAAALASRSAKPEWYGPGGYGGAGSPPGPGGSGGVVPPREAEWT
jgi:hypothetical protein